MKLCLYEATPGRLDEASEPNPCPVSIPGETAPLAPTPEAIQPTPGITCPEGTAPGWLGEDGLPTSCVDNHAVLPVKPEPGVPIVVEPVTVQPITVLPHTAAPDSAFAGVALVLVVTGILLRYVATKFRQTHINIGGK